jgi:16S rRNA (uracil1498-N3)-methyltransferase
MPTRFFLSPDAFSQSELTLPEADAHHVRTVLKMAVGARLLLHDGIGGCYPAELIAVEKRVVMARLYGPREPVATEPSVSMIVCQALPKTGEKLEQVLEHGTEIGAAGFVLFSSERSSMNFEQRERREKKLERWREIVKTAAEQSGRGILPTVHWASGFAEAIQQTSAVTRFVLHLSEQAIALRAALETKATQNPIALFIGPEGGFSEAEAALAEKHRATLISLGPRVLRTETAALAALAQIAFATEPEVIREPEAASD